MRRRLVLATALVCGLIGSTAAGPAWAEDTPATPTPSTPATATADPVDLRLVPANSVGGRLVAPRGTDTNVGFSVFGNSPDATLTLQLPAGLTLLGADLQDPTATVNPATCTSAGSTATCDLGAVQNPDPTLFVNGSLDLHVDPAAAIGTLQVHATVTPVPGPDANPADNSTSLNVFVAGHADVTQQGPDSPVVVTEGGRGTFQFNLHNAGPDPAAHVRTRFTIQSNDATPPTFVDFGDATVVDDNGGKVWEAGTIAPGSTATLYVTLGATGPVTDSEVTWSTSYDGVPELCAGSPSCVFGAQIRSVPGGSTCCGEVAPVPPQLAATGSADGALAVLGLGLLAVGSALTVAAGRRPRRLAPAAGRGRRYPRSP